MSLIDDQFLVLATYSCMSNCTRFRSFTDHQLLVCSFFATSCCQLNFNLEHKALTWNSEFIEMTLISLGFSFSFDGKLNQLPCFASFFLPSTYSVLKIPS